MEFKQCSTIITHLPWKRIWISIWIHNVWIQLLISIQYWIPVKMCWKLGQSGSSAGPFRPWYVLSCPMYSSRVLAATDSHIRDSRTWGDCAGNTPKAMPVETQVQTLEKAESTRRYVITQMDGTIWSFSWPWGDSWYRCWASATTALSAPAVISWRRKGHMSLTTHQSERSLTDKNLLTLCEREFCNPLKVS